MSAADTPASPPASASAPEAEAQTSTSANTSPIENTKPTTADGQPAPRKTRLLKDVEAEENKYIYETLYKSLDDATDTAIRDDLTIGDTMRQARESKKQFLDAASMPIGEKMKGCAALARSLSDERNKQVAYVFVVFSVLILTLPLVMLLLGLHVVAPRLGADPTFCGGGMAVGTALVLVISYVVYAVREERADLKCKAEEEAQARKQK